MQVYVLTYHMIDTRVMGGVIFCIVVDCTEVSLVLVLALFGHRQWIFRPNEKHVFSLPCLANNRA